jgi:arginine/ornithine transport system substrate-binding protein
MKRIGILLAVLLAVVGAADYAWHSLTGDRTLRIAVEGAFPPFNYVGKDGRLQGFDVDIAKALCARIGAHCEIVPQAWGGIIPGLLAEKYDAIVSSMAITEERLEQVVFTDPYYNYVAPQRFVARKGADVAVTRAGLAGKRVGVQRGTVHEAFLRANFPEAFPMLYDNQSAANIDMAAGRLDLLLSDSVALAAGFLATGPGKDFAFVGPPFSDPAILGAGAGIALRRTDGDLLVAFNQALKAIRADGTYKKINDKYFDFDIYGK